MEINMFVYGADIGWLKQFEELGYQWLDEKGEQKDVLDILKGFGINALRFRVFVNPPVKPVWIKAADDICYLGYADANSVLEEAVRAKEKGFRIMIDFHYSDYFADPGCQLMPEWWKGHPYEMLLEDVYCHTYDVLQMLTRREIYPEWVQVGNEINNGIMQPAGSAKEAFRDLAGLLNRGYEAVKAVCPEAKVVTHLAEGQDKEFSRKFFDRFLTEYNGKTDILGLSYYPYWIGSDYTETIENVRENLNTLASRYDKEVMICEIGGNEKEEENSYQFVKEIVNTVKNVPEGKGIGVFWWEPEGNSAILPDGYPLGATRMVDDKTMQFTKALRGFMD
ncbi:MAG: arabinogalactan endo-1,4-beta-galactosidase [Lachnospiraceae bacterium]|nr:arabinogalactan endo-1,4-beta-galactosidase [Lachnospiraceae bacterium]